MLPIFVTAGRGQYSKALRLYLEQMTVQEIQYGALVKTFKVVGLHTVRYTDHEWSGVWTDLSITEEDRDFLLNHWQNTISSTRDLQTKVAVEKKLARAEKSLKFDLSPKLPRRSLWNPLPTVTRRTRYPLRRSTRLNASALALLDLELQSTSPLEILQGLLKEAGPCC